VNGSYEFVIHLDRLRGAYERFEKAIWALNAAIISIAIYALAQYLGLPAFANFYWQDFLPFAASPTILSAVLGIIGATLIRRRNKPDLFPLLGPQLSEKARTACDNLHEKSLPMQSLAADLKMSLSKIQTRDIFNMRQINIRVIMSILLIGVTIFIAHSQISADITPTDFQSLADLSEKAMSLFQNETPSQKIETNLSSNIYGKPSLAVLNEAKLDLMIYPGLGAGSRAKSTVPVERLFQQSQAGDAAAVSSELYIESLPPQNKEIIKKYFEILAASNDAN
jgi:hypothetical protein